ncbi:MAG: hypothetical protein JWQ19_982 [Subtercola sp.]|nr:hypothetical protein [Subtercola sp.]
MLWSSPPLLAREVSPGGASFSSCGSSCPAPSFVARAAHFCVRSARNRLQNGPSIVRRLFPHVSAVLRCGAAWHGSARFGVVWCGAVRSGVDARPGPVRCGADARPGPVRCGCPARPGAVRCGCPARPDSLVRGARHRTALATALLSPARCPRHRTASPPRCPRHRTASPPRSPLHRAALATAQRARYSGMHERHDHPRT